jgi:hypothetical protein
MQRVDLTSRRAFFQTCDLISAAFFILAAAMASLRSGLPIFRPKVGIVQMTSIVLIQKLLDLNLRYYTKLFAWQSVGAGCLR